MMTNVQVAETLLRRGFSAPGSGPIDIFGVSAALAQGLPLYPPLHTDCCCQASLLQEKTRQMECHLRTLML